MRLSKTLFSFLSPFYMFSLPFVAVKNMSAGASAAEYLLAKNTNDATDYYSKESDGTVYDPHGILAEFGIRNSSVIDANYFRNLCAGLNPETGKPLLKVHSKNHRAGTDFAFSPPKSYSAIWAVADKKMRAELEAINAEAVRKSLDFLNAKATTRMGAGGSQTVQSHFVAVQFQHGANRNQEPHLHLHNPILNLTKESNGKWRTLEPRSLFKFQTSADAIYQAHLIKRLQERFPSLKIKATENGHSFEIEQVPEKLVGDWSARRGEMLKKAQEEGVSIDDAGGLDRIFYETRQKKEVMLDPHKTWSDFAKSAHEFSESSIQSIIQASAINRPPLTEDEVTLKLRHAINKLLHTESVFTENQLVRSVSEEFFGHFDADQVLEAIEKLKSGELKLEQADAVVHLGEVEGMEYFSTKSMQSVEKNLSELAGKLSKDNKHLVNKSHIDKAIDDMKILSDEQADLVRHLCSPGSLKIGEGAAGSGKSTSTLAAANAFKAAGYEVIGVAASWNAANILANDANIEGVALAGYLSKLQKGEIKLNKKKVVIVDESGLLGSVGGEMLVSHVEKAGSKAIFLGEEKQLNPVAAGPALSIMMEKAGAQSIETIRRQKTQNQRDMVQDFRSGRIDSALKKLESDGGLSFHKTSKSTLKALVNDWADYTHAYKDKSTIVLAVKNKDVRIINTMIREVLRKRGQITGADVTIKTPASNASTKDTKFAVGDLIVLKKNDKVLGVQNKDAAEITAINETKPGVIVISARLEDGHQIEIDSSKYTDKETGGTAIAHQHAVTQWSSQGATVDKSFVLATGMDRRYAYVGMSRHRDLANLYVDESSLKKNDDKKTTKESIRISLANQLSMKSTKFSTLDFVDDRIKVRMEADKKERKQMVARLLESAQKVDTSSIDRLKEAADLLAKKLVERNQKQLNDNDVLRM